MSNQANIKNLLNGRVKLSTVLDRIEKNMIAQGKGAYDGSCKFFTEDGCRCAVGSLLPKNAEGIVLAKHANGKSFFGLVRLVGKELFDYDLPKSLHEHTDEFKRISNFMDSVQIVHDNAAKKGLTGQEWTNAMQTGFAKVRSEYILKDAKVRPLYNLKDKI